MKRLFGFIFFILCFSLSGLTKQSERDSLEQLLKKANEDTSKVGSVKHVRMHYDCKDKDKL